MSKGKGKKPDHLKAGEQPTNGAIVVDTLSVSDLGQDFVKDGERARGNRSI